MIATCLVLLQKLLFLTNKYRYEIPILKFKLIHHLFHQCNYSIIGFKLIETDILYGLYGRLLLFLISAQVIQNGT